MPRIYLQLQVDFDDDEKVARLARYGKDARACRDLLVGMWRYCKREKSDGNVPLEIVGKLVYPDPPKNGERDAERLVEVGLAERTTDGYYLPGFLKHNKSAAQIAEISRKRADAGKRGGESKKPDPDEANEKQVASDLLNPVEPIDQSSEDRGQSSSSSSLGGERTETLRAVPATDPPKNDELCTRHPDGNPNDEDCRGCQRVEERKARRRVRETDKAARAADAARIACTRCDGTWIVDEQQRPTRRKCDHGVSRVGMASA